MELETVKVVLEGHPRGWKIINKSDFNPETHTLFEGEGSQSLIGRDALDRALAELPGDHTDPDYVVRAMRAHFGAVFTDEDETFVRDLVIEPVKKPSDGLKVDELKAALEAKGIEIPAGALKADLAALLDAAPAAE